MMIMNKKEEDKQKQMPTCLNGTTTFYEPSVIDSSLLQIPV